LVCLHDVGNDFCLNIPCSQIGFIMSSRIGYTLLTVALILFSVASSQAQVLEQQISANQVAANWKSASWQAPSGWQPVVDVKDAEKWAAELAALIRKKDGEAFVNELLDRDHFLETAVSGIPESDYKKGLAQGFNSAIQTMLSQMAGGSDFVVRGIRNTKYGPTVLTRMLNEDDTVTYCLWRLIRNGKGELKAVDFLNLGGGEWTTTTLARAGVLNMPKEASFLGKLSGKQLQFSKSQTQFIKLAEAQKSKDFKLVLKLYRSLPVDLQKEKFVQMMRLNAAMQVDDDEYLEAITELKNEHPNDLTSKLHSIDFYFLKNDFKQMRATIDSLISSLGPDSHLYGLKAVGYSSEDNHGKAMETFKLAIQTEPKREDNYWSLIESALNAKDFDTVNIALKALVNRFGYKEFDLEAVDVYKPFIGTPQHKDFEDYLKTQTQ